MLLPATHPSLPRRHPCIAGVWEEARDGCAERGDETPTPIPRPHSEAPYPQRVCLSCAYRLDDVARIAARASLALPDHPAYVKELDLLVITVRTYHNLLDFRARCVNAIRPTMLWMAIPLIRNPHMLAPGVRLELEWLITVIRCGPGNPAWATMRTGGMPVHVAWRDGLEKLLGHRYEHFPLPVSAFSHELLTGS